MESRIANALWRWKFADKKDRNAIIEDSNICSELEYWFPFSDIEYTRKHGIWCDGVALLSITQLDRLGFIIAGVGYFPNNLVPFELEFHFEKRRDLQPQKTIFRFGKLDGIGQMVRYGIEKHPVNVLSQRPTEDSDWAIVVELPPGNS